MNGYYDMDGNRITLQQFAEMTTEDRFVAKTEVSDKVMVSTVLLVINHAHDNGTPIIFETMVFGGALDQEQDRYSTKAGALAGHECMVNRARESLGAF